MNLRSRKRGGLKIKLSKKEAQELYVIMLRAERNRRVYDHQELSIEQELIDITKGTVYEV